MKVGCVAIPTDIPLLKTAGFDYVELSGRNVCKMEKNAFRELKRCLQSTCMPCLGFNAYCPPEVRIAGPGFSEVAALEYAKRCLERAVELNVQVIGVGSPMSRHLPDGYDKSKAVSEASAFFAVTADVFAQEGIYICVEALGPCYCNFINHLKEAQDIVRSVGMENLKIVLDFYNMEHSAEADISLDLFLPDIVHAHISDDAGSPKARWFLKPDKRDTHWTRVRRLYGAGYLGALTLEIDLPADLKQAVQTLRMLRGCEC